MPSHFSCSCLGKYCGVPSTMMFLQHCHYCNPIFPSQTSRTWAVKTKLADKNKFNVDFLISEGWDEQLATHPSQICISQLPWTLVWWNVQFELDMSDLGQHGFSSFVETHAVTSCMDMSPRKFLSSKFWNVVETSGRQPASHHTKPI